MTIATRWELRLGGIALLFMLWSASVSAEPPAKLALRLENGDSIQGDWLDWDNGERIRWRHPAFTDPLEWPTASVVSITSATGKKRVAAEGEFAIDFHNGDRMFGDWVGGNEESFRFRCAAWGEVLIERSAIRRIIRWNDGERLIYSGPHWPQDRQDLGNDLSAWSMNGSRLTSDANGSEVTLPCQLAPQSTIYLELAWQGRPNFVVSFGVKVDDPDGRSAARLEVWDGELVLLRELARKADVVRVQSLGSTSGKLKLTIFLDQSAGQAVAVSPRGEKLAEVSLPGPEQVKTIRSPAGEDLIDLKWPGPATEVKPGIRFKNVRGEVEIENLLVMGGEDQSMMQGVVREARIVKEDGTTVPGILEAIDDESQTLTLMKAGESETIPLADVSSWYGAGDPAADQADSSPPSDDDVSPDDDTGGGEDLVASPTPPALRLTSFASVQITGTLQVVADGRVSIQSPALDQAVSFPIDQVQAVTIDGEYPVEEASLPGRAGRLELEGLSLHGALLGSETDAGEKGRDQGNTQRPSIFRWHPRGAAEGVPLVDGVSGRIVYRDPTPEPKPPPQRVRQAQPRPGFFGGLAEFFSGEVPMPESQDAGLTLKTGDVVKADVEHIDDTGVSIQGQKTDVSRVSHEHVKAVDLTSGSLMQIDLEKRTRLLTVPRMHRNDPPTHIIVSGSNDFLRGRLLSMNEDSLQFETRLRTMTIPRRLVSRIIWLHPGPPPGRKSEEEAAADEPIASDAQDQPFRVQAIRSDQTRLTFQPLRLKEGTLYGKSEALGPCSIQLVAADQLVLGSEIDEQTHEIPYGEWGLVYAPDPAVLSAEGDAGAAAGSRSELVGQQAPDFRLPLLDGSRFQLNELRGQVVVLDFWASWCGPCMQAMPEIDETVTALADQGVVLISVNLQESPEQIKAALERLEISPAVVLDQDGAVAMKYGAEAIPQTVIIDREGVIARLFVGAGPRFPAQLQAAIQETLAP